MPHNSHFHRQYLILNIINHLGPISRTELTNLTDYRPATVTDIIKELLDADLIAETGNFSVGHGRNRTLLEMNKTRLCAIGISFFSKSVIIVVSQFDGTILKQEKLDFSPAAPKEALIETISIRLENLLHDFSDRKILGVGIGEPPHDPTYYQGDHSLPANFAHFNDWIRLGLKPHLECTLGLPVETYSAVELPVMAEQRFGAAKGVQDFICIELSNGIGASICCNGTAVTGASGIAGELGHTVIHYHDDPQELCYCGKPGCAENTTAFPALVSEIKAALNRGIFSSLTTYLGDDGEITVHAIRKALDEKDRMCMHLTKALTKRLGVVIANAINLLNPKLLILSGFMLQLGDYFLEQLEISIHENTLFLMDDFELHISDSLENILPLGAVAEICSSYLHSHDFKWVYELQPSDLEEHTIIQNNLELTGDIL